jgi:hypothetical protein
MSVLLSLQKDPTLFASGGIKLAGGFFFSPWTNLRCNTPDYYSNAFAPIDSKDEHAYVGDIIFRNSPLSNSKEFQQNALVYLGKGADRADLKDPIASPLFADATFFHGAPPMYFAVGGAETIEGDSVILAQRAAQHGAATYVDVYQSMWHDFPMFSEGCGSGVPLWQAVSALHRTAAFLTGITEGDGAPPCPAGGRRPALMFHYSEPGKDSAKEWFAADFCGREDSTLAVTTVTTTPSWVWALLGAILIGTLAGVTIARRRPLPDLQEPLLP